MNEHLRYEVDAGLWRDEVAAGHECEIEEEIDKIDMIMCLGSLPDSEVRH